MLISDRPVDHVCPRCKQTTVVRHGDSVYVCLDRRCGFRHDVADGIEGGGPIGAFLGGGFAILVGLALL